MLDENLKYLSNYLWQQSNACIYDYLSDETQKNFNISDYYYLYAIAHMNEPTLTNIAHMLHLTRPAISALIKRLETHNLIHKVQSDYDKRVYYLRPTSQGLALLDQHVTPFDSISKVISDTISPDELKALNCLLEVIIKLLPAS